MEWDRAEQQERKKRGRRNQLGTKKRKGEISSDSHHRSKYDLLMTNSNPKDQKDRKKKRRAKKRKRKYTKKGNLDSLDTKSLRGHGNLLEKA